MSTSIADALRALEAADPALGSPAIAETQINSAWTDLVEVRDDVVIFGTVPRRRPSRTARVALIAACVLAVIATAITVVALRGGGKSSSQPAGPLVIPPGFSTTEAQAAVVAERLLPLVQPLPGARRIASVDGSGLSIECVQPVLCAKAVSYWKAPGTAAHALAFYQSYFKVLLTSPTARLSGGSASGTTWRDVTFVPGTAGAPFIEVGVEPVSGGVHIAITTYEPWYPERAAVETVTDVQSVAVTTKKGDVTPLPGRTLTGPAAQRLADAVNNYAVWTPASPGGCNIGYIPSNRPPFVELQVYKAVFTTPTETVSLYGGDTCVSVLVRNAKTGVMRYEPDLYGPFGKLVTAALKP